MVITNDFLYSFINCRYKAYLKRKGHLGIANDYQLLFQQLKERQIEKFKLLIEERDKAINHGVLPDTFQNQSFIFNRIFSNSEFSIIVDAVNVTYATKVTPVFITPFEKITIADRLFIVLQTILVQTYFGINTEFCSIISGTKFKVTKFRTSAFNKSNLKLVKELLRYSSLTDPPFFLKNKHCSICEFNADCMKRLIERDDLSLLGTMKPQDIFKRNKQGVFSVTQLSYLFRPKKIQLQI